MMLIYSSILAILFIGIHGQTTQLYNIYHPNQNNSILQIQMSFDNDEARFVVNMEIIGNHWAGLGFAQSTTATLGDMFGVDAWIYGDFGGSSEEVLEYGLGDHEIGTEDPQQNLEYSIYDQGSSVQVHIERDLVTGTRDDYDIVEGGNLCILWALGKQLQVESGHNTTTRGMECFDIPGTTQPPTPPPSYFPTKAPTNDPTVRPTNFPTTVGGTFPPSPSPTERPTELPTTSSPSVSPTNQPTGVPGSPTGDPTQAPTDPPTKDATAPTRLPTESPSDAPTPQFNDNEPTEAGADVTEKAEDAFEQWTWIIIGALALLVLCLLAAIVFCYIRNRRIRQQRNKEKEEAYEQLENYRAKHGLDIPENTPKKRDDDDDIEAGIGNAAKSGIIPDNDVNSEDGDDDDEDNDKIDMNDVAPPPAYAPPTAGGIGRKAGRGPKKPPRNRPAYRTKDLTVDDDDDDVINDMQNTPAGPEDTKGDGNSKFVDPNKERRERIRKERNKRVNDRAKLAQSQASESTEKQKRLQNQKSNSKNKGKSNDDDEDDYDYEAARKEREERRRRREARRQRQKKKQGKFGVFDDDNW